MILDLAYISKSLYIFNQIRFRLIYLLLSLIATDLYMEDFPYLANTLTFIGFI